MKTLRSKLPSISPLTFGSGGITDPANADHLGVARAAMDAGIWFHCANYAGGVYAVLQKVFDERPGQIPRCIFKLDGTGAEGFVASLDEALRKTGLNHIDIGQVCGNTLCKDTDALSEALLKARKQGKVGGYIMDVIPAYSPRVIEFVREDIFDGYIFYYNVTECGLSNAALAAIESRGLTILAMRTFGGRDGGNFLAGPGSTPQRRELEQVYERSGCRSRMEFCVRFALSAPGVKTTVGSTSHVAHLQEFLNAGHAFKPLDAGVVKELYTLHRKWNAGV